MYVLTLKARLKYIEDTLWELYEKHEDFTLDTTDNYMSLTICPHHIEGADVAQQKEIKEAQKKCDKYPNPNFFLDGCCEHYRAVTGGHCDYDIVRFKEVIRDLDKAKTNSEKVPEKEKEKLKSAMGFMGGYKRK